MRHDSRQLAMGAIRRNDHRNALAGAVAGAVAAIAIGVMEWLSVSGFNSLEAEIREP